MPMPAKITKIGDRVTISRLCPWCNLDASIEVGLDAYNAWMEGAHVQNVWPSLSVGEREVIISGTHPHCWDLMWAE